MARDSHNAINIDKTMVIFGGFSPNEGKYLNDVWQFDFESK